MSAMNIVVPMAGHGSRFSQAGFETPKPLIPIHGIPMYRWALKSLPIALAESLTLIVLREHSLREQFVSELAKEYPRTKIHVLELSQTTRGQSETVLRCRDLIPSSLPLLIYNCDSFFQSAMDWKSIVEASDISGLLVCFENSDPRYSYARADDSGRVDLVLEKQVISSFACTGAYYFGSTANFMSIAENSISTGDTSLGEFYVAPLYNDLIKKGGLVKAILCDRFGCFGTPEELKQFEATFTQEDYFR